MKICMVARTTLNHSRGGMQEDLQTLAEGAVKAGHRVIVITSRHPGGVSVGEESGVEIHYLCGETQNARKGTSSCISGLLTLTNRPDTTSA